MSEENQASKYNEAYKELRNCVDQVRRTDISNIDDLVPLVEKTTQAYNVCKDRLNAVEKLIKDSFGDNELIDKENE